MNASKPLDHRFVPPAATRRVLRAWRHRHRPATVRLDRGARATTWAGRLLVLYGAAHTAGALTVEGAARHAGAWFSGELRGADLADMSPAMAAYWLSVNSFGVPLVVVGLTVLWLDARGITPPSFIAWTLGTWTVVDAVVAPMPPQWLIPLAASGLLLAGPRLAAGPVMSGPASDRSGA